ncbi:DUF2169 domain-containing protein [Paracoccus sp. Ld10]|uniref:DUF2169 family type VI secretion system accessory protein n=1 Tax=Paracoccus sp. Ld10 TaxID=649158 RepID=UPI003863FB49
MWQIVNQTPFETAGYFLRDAQGAEHWVVAMRATLDLPHNALPALAARQQQVALLPVVDASGEELLEDSDLAPFRPHCDILLRGTATPNTPSPLLSFPVSLSVGNLERTIHCHGRRRLVRTRFGHKVEYLGPAAETPLSWRYATGGRDCLFGKAEAEPHPDNPIGVGWCADPGKMRRGDNLTLAPLDDAPHTAAQAAGPPLPTGFGAIAHSWRSRRLLAGTYDERWASTRHPLPPTDFDNSFHQSAPPGQRADLRGGEAVHVRNASSGPPLTFRIPQIISDVRTRIGHVTSSNRMRLIALTVDAVERRGTMVWNVAVPCQGQDAKVSLSTILLTQVSGLVMS